MTDQSVAFENPSAGLSLAGTLSLPERDTPCPAAILVHGQGALDRDMSFGHLKPFRTLANHLQAKGIASLRYDKRGVGRSQGEFASVTQKELAGDVVAALSFMERHDAIMQDCIGLIGLSEGGVIAPMVASVCDDVAFVVLLAAPAVSGRENLSLSFSSFAEASPVHDLSAHEIKRSLDRLIDLVSLDSALPEDRVEALQLAESVAPLVINHRTNMVLGGADATGEQFISLLSSPCMQETVDGNPEKGLTALTCPVLALYGDKDRHVPARENAAAMRRSLEAAGNPDYTIETITDCNHLFQRCETGYPDEYFTIDHDISPDVLDRVSRWIVRVAQPDQRSFGALQVSDS
jgi:pimeloyl-ACP methyl ester carboxylesterase